MKKRDKIIYLLIALIILVFGGIQYNNNQKNEMQDCVIEYTTQFNYEQSLHLCEQELK